MCRVIHQYSDMTRKLVLKGRHEQWGMVAGQLERQTVTREDKGLSPPAGILKFCLHLLICINQCLAIDSDGISDMKLQKVIAAWLDASIEVEVMFV